MMRHRYVLVGCVFVLFAAKTASAQGFLNPFIGASLTSPSPSSDASKMGYGIAFGSLGKLVGFETELSYFPELLDNDAEALSKSKSVTFAASTLIGPTIHRIKPYGAIGAGTIYLNVANLTSIVVPNPESISNTYFALNIGGGVGGFFSSHFGVKGDLRYFKAYGFDLNDFEGTSVRIDNFNFWRGTVGALIGF
jgi:hypothetical protein